MCGTLLEYTARGLYHAFYAKGEVNIGLYKINGPLACVHKLMVDSCIFPESIETYVCEVLGAIILLQVNMRLMKAYFLQFSFTKHLVACCLILREYHALFCSKFH